MTLSRPRYYFVVVNCQDIRSWGGNAYDLDECQSRQPGEHAPHAPIHRQPLRRRPRLSRPGSGTTRNREVAGPSVLRTTAPALSGCARRENAQYESMTVPPFKIKVVDPFPCRPRRADDGRPRRLATTRFCFAPRTSSSTCSRTAAPPRSRRRSAPRWSSATSRTPARAASSASRRRCATSTATSTSSRPTRAAGRSTCSRTSSSTPGKARPVEPVLHDLARARRARRRRFGPTFPCRRRRTRNHLPVQGQHRSDALERVLARPPRRGSRSSARRHA